MRRILAYFVLFVVVLMFAMGGYVGRRNNDFVILEYGSLQIEQLNNGDHTISDAMVRNAVKLCWYYHKEEAALRQLDIVYNVDSNYWPVMYCKAVIFDYKGRGIVNKIRYYERAWDLMEEPGAEFDAGGHIIFDEFKFSK